LIVIPPYCKNVTNDRIPESHAMMETQIGSLASKMDSHHEEMKTSQEQMIAKMDA
jgi:hypothetical protein